MKTVQAVAQFAPESGVGIQCQLSDLLLALRGHGIDSQVAAPQTGAIAGSASRNGLPVYRYPAFPASPPAPNDGVFSHHPFDRFAHWLREQQADLFHQHQWTPACGSAHLRVATALGMATVVSIVCPDDGDGQSQLRPERLRARHYGLLEMAKYADRILTPSQWLHDRLRLNGVASEKLMIWVPKWANAIAPSPLEHLPLAPPRRPLRVVCCGPWHPASGFHVLVDAIKTLPGSIPVELTLYAAPQPTTYEREVMTRLGRDSRIQVHPPLAPPHRLSVLSQYDVLALPLQTVEAQPIKGDEVQACGLPVLGSNLGDIPEWLHHRRNGLLVPADDSLAWAMAMVELALNPKVLHQLQQGIAPRRALTTEATEMAALYRTLVRESRCHSSATLAASLQGQPQ